MVKSEGSVVSSSCVPMHSAQLLICVSSGNRGAQPTGLVLVAPFSTPIRLQLMSVRLSNKGGLETVCQHDAAVGVGFVKAKERLRLALQALSCSR
jgi:hypothetical protein